MGRECRPAVWTGSVDRRNWESLPFWQIFAVWVEIYNKQTRDSLPFSDDFRCLGREIRPAATGNLYPFRQFFAVWVEISNRRLLESLPFSAVFRCLGRDLQTPWRNARVLHPTSHAFNDSNPLNACACPMLHPTSRKLYDIKKLWLHFLTMRNQSSVIYYYFSTNVTGHPNL